MKILVTNPYFFPHPGGSQRYIEELYSNLMTIDKNISIDILTYNTEHRKNVEKYKNFTVYRVNCWEILRGQFAIPNYIELFKLIRYLKSNKYDILNSHTRFFDNSWWSPLAAKYLGAKAVLTDHCAYHPQHNNIIVRIVAKWVDKLSIPMLGKLYDQVTAVSATTKMFLVKSGMKRKIEVIPGGVNLKEYKRSAIKLSFLKNLTSENIVISFVGRMIPSKGAQLLLETAEKLKGNKNLTFVFAGEGELFTSLKKRSSKNIIFTGNLARSEVTKLLKQTDILVHPSMHHEGLPSVILEAGAAGCAVIATSRGGTTEMITHAQTGLIVQPTVKSIENALKKLIKNIKLRTKLGNNLQNKITKEYDWNLIAQKYLKLLKDTGKIQ